VEHICIQMYVKNENFIFKMRFSTLILIFSNGLYKPTSLLYLPVEIPLKSGDSIESNDKIYGDINYLSPHCFCEFFLTHCNVIFKGIQRQTYDDLLEKKILQMKATIEEKIYGQFYAL